MLAAPQDRRIHRIESAVSHGLEHLVAIAHGGRGDDEDDARGGLHDAPRGLRAIDAGHDEVHQNDVGPGLCAQPERLFAGIRGPGEREIGQLGKDAPQNLCRHFRVVHNGDLHSSSPEGTGAASPTRSTTACRKLPLSNDPLVR